MSTREERNKAVVRRYADEVWGEGNVDAMDELLTPEQVYHDPTFSGAEHVDEFKEFIRGYRAAFPDLRYDVEGIVAEDDYVAFWGRVRGTQEGEFLGVPPTGNRIDIMGIGVVRLEDGKIAERWANFDVYGMMKQLDADPTVVDRSDEAE
ncbi:ester cyclase [Haladaptatus salinisoli]|uniref:ester cyclase n=1 Tax=Haladaptatus salinisoli TaxID=2884876 RepID=UPI001D0AFA7E|nr:ester cyclase [Haladaptatus salinisoli]